MHLEEAYRPRFTEFLSVKRCYEDKLVVGKHNGSSVPRGAMNIGLLSRGTGNDFPEQTNESRTLG